eukprot:13252481-Alexandrium_andersonii.AAC.1
MASGVAKQAGSPASAIENPTPGVPTASRVAKQACSPASVVKSPTPGFQWLQGPPSRPLRR